MALTSRTNGSGGSNIITSDWFNDFLKLLTGVMTDQPVTINNGLTLKQDTFTTPTAPSLALATGTNLGIGAYTYGIAFQMGNGQTLPGTTAATTTTTGNQKVNLSSIPLGPTGTSARIVYRSKVGTTSPLYVVASIADNTTTTYSDTTADASLTVQAPAHDSFGGYLFIENSSGAGKAQIFSDGAVSFDAGAITSNAAGILSLVALVASGITQSVNGSTSGTLTTYETFTGNLKIVLAIYNNFKNAGSAVQITLNTAFSTMAFFFNGGGQTTNLMHSGSAKSLQIITSLASGAGSSTPHTGLGPASFGWVSSGFEAIQEPGGDGSTATGIVIIIGV